AICADDENAAETDMHEGNVDGVCVFYFFFQAEDGIRDKLVTGVQTCALPISPDQAEGEQPEDRIAGQPMQLVMDVRRHPGNEHRSEERRVGKECRSRWSA